MHGKIEADREQEVDLPRVLLQMQGHAKETSKSWRPLSPIHLTEYHDDYCNPLISLAVLLSHSYLSITLPGVLSSNQPHSSTRYSKSRHVRHRILSLLSPSPL